MDIRDKYGKKKLSWTEEETKENSIRANINSSKFHLVKLQVKSNLLLDKMEKENTKFILYFFKFSCIMSIKLNPKTRQQRINSISSSQHLARNHK